jgi:hypothetical protein
MKNKVLLVMYANRFGRSILAELHGLLGGPLTDSGFVNATMPCALLARRQESSTCLLFGADPRNCVCASRADFLSQKMSRGGGLRGQNDNLRFAGLTGFVMEALR